MNPVAHGYYFKRPFSMMRSKVILYRKGLIDRILTPQTIVVDQAWRKSFHRKNECRVYNPYPVCGDDFHGLYALTRLEILMSPIPLT